jgi:hypothetical protein
VEALLEMFRTRSREQVRASHEWIVTIGYLAVAVLPALLWPPALDPLHTAYSGWPSVCLFALLVVGMATDSFDRPLQARALCVAGWMVLHLGVLVPVFEFVGHRAMGIDALAPAVAAPFWAATRAYAGFMVLTFAMRSSSLMVRWAETAQRAKVPEIAG